jgi:prevent-host-death family protein
MRAVTIRDLRRSATKVISEVHSTGPFVITRNGTPLAQLVPVPARPLDSATVLARWRGLPVLDPSVLRADIDRILDPSTNLPLDTVNPVDFEGIERLTGADRATSTGGFEASNMSLPTRPTCAVATVCP